MLTHTKNSVILSNILAAFNSTVSDNDGAKMLREEEKDKAAERKMREK
jgi:hypothetical protein